MMVQHIVINTCFGGFGLSEEAVERMKELGYKDKEPIFWVMISRSDPILVRVVEELGAKANDQLSDLKIVEIPDGVEWAIEEYDGKELIVETHRTWR